jgi:hypothetical protein
MPATVRPGLWIWSCDLFPDREFLARARRKLESEFDHCDFGDLAFGLRIPDQEFSGHFHNTEALRRFSARVRMRLGKLDFVMTDPDFPHDGYWLRFFLPYADNAKPNRMFAWMNTRIIDGGVVVKLVTVAPQVDAAAVADAYSGQLLAAMQHPEAIAAGARMVTIAPHAADMPDGGVGLIAEIEYDRPFLDPWIHLYFSLRTLPRPFWPEIEFSPSSANAARYPRAETIHHDFSPKHSPDRR